MGTCCSSSTPNGVPYIPLSPDESADCISPAETLEGSRTEYSHYERLTESPTDEEDGTAYQGRNLPPVVLQENSGTEAGARAPPIQQRKHSHELMPSQRQHSLDQPLPRRKYSLEHTQPSSQGRPDVPSQTSLPLVACELQQKLMAHQQEADVCCSGSTEQVSVSHNAKPSSSNSLTPCLTISSSQQGQHPNNISIQHTPTLILTPTTRAENSQCQNYALTSPNTGVVTARPRTIMTCLLPPPTATTSPSPTSPSSLSSCSSSSSSCSLAAGDIKRRSSGSHALDLADISEEPQYENTLIAPGKNCVMAKSGYLHSNEMILFIVSPVMFKI